MDVNASLMSEGPLRRQIVCFAIPIFWGNLFQQLYNVVDFLIVGNFVGSDALAGVAATSSLIFLVVSLFNGLFIGAGVVISRYYGAENHEQVRLAVHTSIAFAVLAGLLFTGLGVAFTPAVLRLMGTPPAVMPTAILYLRIYFGGILAVVLYNAASGIFQAVGDSRHPLYYLILSSLLNVALDLLFVEVWGLGVGGTAAATVISQSVSVLLAFWRLCHSTGSFHIIPSQIRLHKATLLEILRIGLPAGMQNCLMSLGNLVVQSNINSFGAMAIAGCGAYTKINGFGFLPITSFTLALTTFIGQNLGAKQYERAKQGAAFGIWTAMLLSELIGVLTYWFAPALIGIFSADPVVIQYGVMQARVQSLFHFLLTFSHCIAAILRGAGKSTVPMLVMMLCWCFIRVVYTTLILRFIPDIRCVFWAYPLTWFLSSAIFLFYYRKADWLHAYECDAVQSKALS